MDRVADVFEEVTFWSSRFGVFLLNHIELRRDIDVLDLGCAGGFPLIELANMHGPSSRFIGLDIWGSALRRARGKVEFQGLSNVHLVQGDAASLPFCPSHFDLITSNLGVNNFENPDVALGECARVARTGGRLVITTNLKGHMESFYDVFRAVVTEQCPERLPQLEENENHRGTRESVVERIEAAGFVVARIVEDSLPLRFLDGSALLRHNLCQWFLLGWREVVVEEDRLRVFAELERRLNVSAASRGELRMQVPMLYVEATLP